MKKSIFLLIVLLSVTISAQETNKPAAFSKFHFGLYGGPNFTFPLQTGYLIHLEARTNITSRLNIKASIGFSSLFEDKDKNITTYHCFTLNQAEYYRSEFYNIEKYEYAVLPLSIGLEYSLAEGEYSPYLICEGGYNVYSVEVRKSNQISGAAGTFSSLDQLPAQYRNKPPQVPDDTSFRIGLGIGTRISITKGINLELRYLYNINTSLINSHQLLAGISI